MAAIERSADYLEIMLNSFKDSGRQHDTPSEEFQGNIALCSGGCSYDQVFCVALSAIVAGEAAIPEACLNCISRFPELQQFFTEKKV